MLKQTFVLFSLILVNLGNQLFAAGSDDKAKPQINIRIHTGKITSVKENLLKEISGAVYFNGGLWVLNDAGNSNSIYRIDTLSGTILQTVIIINAKNTEELTCSETDLYIGDFGNNFGDRKNLCIYKIPLELITTETTEVSAKLIHFNYPEQHSFAKAANASDFDCEAMCYYKNKIHLFTKNWKSSGSTHYTLETEEGFYSALKEEKIETDYLVSGCFVKDDMLVLVGYSLNELTVKATKATFDSADHCIDALTYSIGHLAAFGQVESIVMNGNQGWMLSESTDLGFLKLPARIISFKLQLLGAE
jgi:hypothetical protein